MEEARTKRISIDAKRSRSFNSGSSNGTLDIKDKTLFKKRVFNQDSSRNPKYNQEKGSGSRFPNPICTNYGKKHHGST